MKSNTMKMIKQVTFAGFLSQALVSSVVIAGPEGWDVTSGGVNSDITQSGSTTTITQNSSSMSINWQSFNVDAGEVVNYIQNPTDISMNFINSSNGASQILGNINADGHIFLFNSSGIIFGSTAQVNVGSLFATTLEMSSQDDGRLNLGAGDQLGVIVNHGVINASSGSVVLAGNSVINTGLISANAGTVTLASGSAATLDFDGDGLMQFVISSDVTSNLGEANGVSNAEGGEIFATEVILTAQAASGVFNNIINNDGLLKATRIDTSGGSIKLTGTGGSVTLGSTSELDAAGEGDNTGGSVRIVSSTDDVVHFGSIVANQVSLQATNRDIFQRGYIAADTDITLAARRNITRTPALEISQNFRIFHSPEGEVIELDPPVNPTPTPPIEEGGNGDLNDIVNANAVASADAIQDIAAATSTSLGLYEVEGSGIKLPADQDEF